MLEKKIRQAYAQGEGILRLAPVFVPRLFSQPGHRLKLHPDDYFALGTQRGAMKERWFSCLCVVEYTYGKEKKKTCRHRHIVKA